MIRLLAPDPTRYDAFADCLAEYGGAGLDGSSVRPEDTLSLDRPFFDGYLRARAAEEDEAAVQPAGRVPCTSRWIVEDDWEDGGPLLGFIALRHALNPFLFDQGGHIGYSVRPAARRRGTATAALALALGAAQRRGIDPVLVTCLEDNEASRRIIEAAGGQYEDSREGHRRYWIGRGPVPTAPDVP